MQTRECHAEPTLLIQTQRRYPPKYRRVYHLQEELSRTQAVRAPFSLGQARFPCESFGWDYFLIFQRDFLDIDLYSYAIWWEFSMKKKKKSQEQTERAARAKHPVIWEVPRKRMALKCQETIGGRAAISQGAEEKKCSESLAHHIPYTANP